MNGLRFEWDPTKAKSNLRKHRVSFEEATTVWRDPNARFFDDPSHSDEEDRGKAVGYSERGRLLAVIFTVRDDGIRLISAKKATAGEETTYAENLG